MIGTFSPQQEPYTHEMPEETAPSGFMARGSYTAKSKDDESLRKWKEQLLGSVDINNIGETLDPEVKFLSVAIVSPERPDMVLSIPEDGKPQGLWFTLKEGSHYRLKFSFQVSNNIVSGLRYTNTVWKSGLRFLDDDNKCHLEINYTFDIRKDWASAD
ncbi:hypothetical protein GOBAR_AA12380 [Gossypium barbadense]|uniref:Rho GDP-dissociation inhibitor 1 n=1 Tax=Gossypium barbadense TaxID=3634 RepID=A0A2P5XY41_GOSBA|nr:hypothetical protein GOBAR_AA12380 [Gossypium barbadense]